MNPRRFRPTRILNDDGTWTDEWYVLDTWVDDDNPYIGPCHDYADADAVAARYNRHPVLAPTTPSVDYSGGFLEATQ